MARAHGIDDLFGHVPQAGELRLPEASHEPQSGVLIVGGFPLERVDGGETPETVRAKFVGLLAFVRTKQTMPWDARDLRFFTGMIPYWAEWLKNGEGDGLLAEFKTEMDRLGAPADQVAPNWRKIWDIAA